jgi:hypothetical protein
MASKIPTRLLAGGKFEIRQIVHGMKTGFINRITVFSITYGEIFLCLIGLWQTAGGHGAHSQTFLTNASTPIH